MSLRNPQRVGADYSAEMRRAAIASLVLAGSAAAALALASYLAKQQRGEKVALGSGASSLEGWLRDTASRLHQGSQSMIENVDHAQKRF